MVAPLEYKVFNRCFKSVIGGERIEYTGSAEPHQGESMSSIDMTYFWVFTKNYNVYYLEADYTYVVVADAGFKQVWIMSRKPTIPQEKLNEITKYISASIDLNTLIYTPQDEEGRHR